LIRDLAKAADGVAASDILRPTQSRRADTPNTMPVIHVGSTNSVSTSLSGNGDPMPNNAGRDSSTVSPTGGMLPPRSPRANNPASSGTASTELQPRRDVLERASQQPYPSQVKERALVASSEALSSLPEVPTSLAARLAGKSAQVKTALSEQIGPLLTLHGYLRISESAFENERTPVNIARAILEQHGADRQSPPLFVQLDFGRSELTTLERMRKRRSDERSPWKKDPASFPSSNAMWEAFKLLDGAGAHVNIEVRLRPIESAELNQRDLDTLAEKAFKPGGRVNSLVIEDVSPLTLRGDKLAKILQLPNCTITRLTCKKFNTYGAAREPDHLASLHLTPVRELCLINSYTDLSALGKAVGHSQCKLTSLELEDASLSKDLVDGLAKNRSLERLRLEACLLEDTNVDVLEAACGPQSTVRDIDASRSKFNESAKRFLQKAGTSPALKNLVLRDSEGMRVDDLCLLVNDSSKLESLDVSRAKVYGDLAKLREELNRHPTLQALIGIETTERLEGVRSGQRTSSLVDYIAPDQVLEALSVAGVRENFRTDITRFLVTSEMTRDDFVETYGRYLRAPDHPVVDLSDLKRLIRVGDGESSELTLGRYLAKLRASA
jgi:hypothetical protein